MKSTFIQQGSLPNKLAVQYPPVMALGNYTLYHTTNLNNFAVPYNTGNYSTLNTTVVCILYAVLDQFCLVLNLAFLPFHRCI